MTDLLGRIDAAISGLCPCGADPAPGYAYCSYDCTPTHVAGDTDPSGPGEYGAQSTPMRWRPDLVSEHDDSHLTLSTRFRRGRYTATVYEINDADGVHCRLDDGNRFVGLDADTYQFISEQGLEPVWQRLERELGNSRHLDPDVDPWADVFEQAPTRIEPDWHHGWQRRCAHCGERSVPRQAVRVAPTPPLAWVRDCGSEGQPGDVLLETETCHACSACGRAFPGPALLVMRTDLREADLTEYRMRIGDRQAVLRVHYETLERQRHPEVWLQHRLDRMEQELLIAYARAHPDRPDVAEWAEACNGTYRRDAQRHLQMLGLLTVDPEAARSMFQNLT